MKFKNLWLLAASVILVTACGDDDDKKPSNTFTYDGVKRTVQYASFDASYLEEGNYSLVLSPNEDPDAEAIEIELSAEWDGQTVNLTEVDDEYDWSWYVDYYATENDDTNRVFSGFGTSEDAFEDVTGGSLYIKLLDADKNIFEVKATIETTEGKTMEIYYKGVFVDSDVAP